MVEHGAMETGGDVGTSAEEAQARLNQIYQDKSHPYNTPGVPAHDDALEEVLALRRVILGSENRKLVEYR
jgi:hypothetical protein